ncbi:hypothetical protein K7X08_009778 [Anisodus acutangulus]|uniref:Myb-like domain-containing protein n=1 Tax=Anisodus acutangulus TaxID=402998 RepID=A0A9Q1MZY3_9SOLA|nr:hypothetical protein K7X08_009778 [Anisodus acutangulus]
MSHDDTRYENQVQDSSVAAYVVTFSDTNEMNKFWQMALEKEKSRKAAVNFQEENDDENASRLPQNLTVETSTENTSSADTDAAIRAHDLKGKRKANSDRSEENGENRDIEKKRRVIWTPKMHQNFVQAIHQLGHEKAVPKKIVEIMNEPGLTREHVASHLQKYRMCVKRAQESSAASIYDQILSNDAKEKCFRVQPYLSSLNFSDSQRYSHSIQQPFQTQFQQGTGGMNVPTSSLMGSFQQQNSHLDFANSRQEDHSSLIGQHSTFVPRIAHGSNFRVYGDKRKNMLFSIQSGSTLGNTNQPTNSNSGLEFFGFRLSKDGKSVNFGHKGSSCAVISNNAYSGLCSSISEDYIHKQQASPQFLETPIGNTLTQCSSVPPEGFTYNHPSNNISEQQGLLLFDNAANKISCQSPEMTGSLIPQEQLSAQAAQRSSGDLEYYSAILFGDEVSVSPLENDGNYDSRQQQYSAPVLPQAEDDYYATIKALNSKGRFPRKSIGQDPYMEDLVTERFSSLDCVKKGQPGALSSRYARGPGKSRTTGGCASLSLLQEEAAVLMVDSSLRSSEYGPINIFINFYSDPEYKFKMLRTNFFPQPKVDAAVASFRLKQPVDYPPVSSAKSFFSVVLTAYPFKT